MKQNMDPERDKGRAGDSVAVSKERLRLWLKLLKASRLIEMELRERLRSQFDTTLPRFDVLAALSRSPKGLRMSNLSSELMVSNGNVTGIVDRLVADGLIIRIPVKDDRRAMTVRLTQKGQEVFQTYACEHEKWVSELLGGFDGNEAMEFGKMLTRISDADMDHSRTDDNRQVTEK